MAATESESRKEILEEVAETNAAGPFSADWDSLTGVGIPEWYREGKFGIFIHWGVYSVPAFENEWYPRNMYIEGSDAYNHHVASYGPHTSFGYKDFIPQLTADKFDADEWASLFRRAGAKFVVPVAEHHDGFAMYDTALSRWKATEMGPKRDVLGELAQAIRKQAMTFGLSSHRAEHWFFFNGGAKFESGVLDPEFIDFYGPAQRQELQPTQAYLEDWLARTAELVDKYQPELVWFDWWIEEPSFAPYLQEFAAYFYNKGVAWNREVAINHKYDSFPAGTAVFDVERGQLSDIRPDFWQTDTSVSKNSWSYVVPQDYRSGLGLIADLVDIVSKNGALLLNIGPRADGTIPQPEIDLLEQIGAWLNVNGEAIYGTTPWKISGEGPTAVAEGAFTDTHRADFTPLDIRFTAARGDLYATVLAPTDDAVVIKSLAAGSGAYPDRVASVHLLGTGPAEFSQDADGLKIMLPDGAPRGTLHSFRIIATPRPEVVRHPSLQQD